MDFTTDIYLNRYADLYIIWLRAATDAAISFHLLSASRSLYIYAKYTYIHDGICAFDPAFSSIRHGHHNRMNTLYIMVCVCVCMCHQIQSLVCHLP